MLIKAKQQKLSFQEVSIALPNMPSWRGAQLKHWGNFTFTFKKSL
jgi:hypothetical protein